MFENLIAETPGALSILVSFVILSLYALYSDHEAFNRWVLKPYEVNRTKNFIPIVTSSFIHGSLGHLFFNGITFFFFAFPLEYTVGTLNFLIIYFVSMVIADIPSLIQYKNDPNYATLGASGAVSGVLYAYILFYPMNKIFLFMIPIGIPAWIFAILYIIGSIYASRYGWGNINHSAHIAGAIAGFIIAVILYPNYFMTLFERIFN